MNHVVHGPAGLLCFEKLRIEIVGTIPPGGRPRRDQLHVFESDGSLYTGQLLSPSAIGTGEKCERQFGFVYIDKMPKKETLAQKVGTDTHAELEAWLTEGTPPRSHLLTSSGALVHFPPPKARGLLVETVFAFRVTLLRAPEALDVAGAREVLTAGEDVSAVLYGYKDAQLILPLALPPVVEVYDLKTTSSLNWKKTVDELLVDTQSVVYAADALLEAPGSDDVRLRWVYTQTKGAHRSSPTEVRMDWAHLEQVLANRVARAWRLGTLKETMSKGMAKTLKPNPRACGDYGGCDFLALCDDLKAATGFLSLAKQSRLEESRKPPAAATPQTTTTPSASRSKTMTSIMAKMRADIAQREGGAAKVAGLEAQAKSTPVSSTTTPTAPTAPSVPAPPAPPAPTPPAPPAPPTIASTPATAPKPAGLRGILAKMKGEPAPAPAPVLAVGINPPDARPPGLVEAPAPAPAPTPAPTEAPEAAPQAEVAPAPAPTPAPTEAAPQAEAARKPRAKKATAEAPAPASTEKAPLPRDWAEVDMPASLAAPSGFMLLLDVAPVKGMAFSNIEDVISAARAKVELEAGMSYRLIEYNKGPAFLAEQVEENMRIEAPRGAFFASSYGLDKEVLDVLIRHAAVVMRATR